MSNHRYESIEEVSLLQNALLQKLYNNSRNSDVTLVLTGGERIHAHTATLAQASEVFLKAFYGAFTTASEYTIQGHDEDVAQALVKHMYGFDVVGSPPTRYGKDKETGIRERDQYIDSMFKLYLIGNEFQVPSLCHSIAKKCAHWTFFTEEVFKRTISFYNNQTIGDPVLMDAVVDEVADAKPGYVEALVSKDDPERRYDLFYEKLTRRFMSGFRGELVRDSYCRCYCRCCDSFERKWSKEFITEFELYAKEQGIDDERDP